MPGSSPGMTGMVTPSAATPACRSTGADREVARLLELGLPVYRRLEDVPDPVAG